MRISRPVASKMVVLFLVLTIVPAIAQETELDRAEPVLSAMLSDLAQGDAHREEHNLPAVVTMLQAARRLDASNSEAAELLAESLEAMGEMGAAAEALDDYIAMQPENEVALAKRISLALASLQTSEERQNYLMGLAIRSDLPDGILGVIYQELAHLSFESANEQVGRALLSRAAAADMHNLAVRQEMHELMDPEVPAIQKVLLLAQMVRINPLRLQVVWRFANGLDEVGLHKEAQKWYKYAWGAHLTGTGGSEIGPEELLDLASSYVLSQDHDKALLVLNRIVGQYPERVDIHIWATRAALGLGEQDKAQTHLSAAENLLLSQAQQSPEDLAVMKQLAWFYLQDKPDKDEALSWATKAEAVDPEDSRVQLCMGLALLADGQIDQARISLEPLSENDPWAKLAMIRILLSADYTEEELEQNLANTFSKHSGGWVGLAVRELAKAQNINLPTDQFFQQLTQGINEQLGSPAELRDFYRKPQAYLYLKLRPTKEVFNSNDPLGLQISLTNLGSIAITMGPGMMFEPRLVLSAQLSGGLQKELKYYDFISLYNKRLLNPGEGLGSTVQLDRGKLHKLLRACPQETVTIRLQCILDPQVVGEDEYLPSLGGQISGEVVLVRYGFDPRPEAMERLYHLLRNSAMRKRIQSIVLLGNLLANSQFPRAVPEAKMPRAVDEEQITAALIETSQTADWRVRAYFGESLESVRLNPSLSKALAEQIRDPHWFVRLMAARAAGNRGPSWTEILRRMAQTDEDGLVRQMASSYLNQSQ